jgi:hypothetical protein
LLRSVWEKFAFDHEDILYVFVVIVLAASALLLIAGALGLAYRVFEIAGGL